MGGGGRTKQPASQPRTLLSHAPPLPPCLQKQPIIIETPSAIRRKDELERRLREIEDATKIFSRPKVLVHM